MLDANLKSQLEAYLKNIVHPVELVASLGAGPKSIELKTLLDGADPEAPQAVRHLWLIRVLGWVRRAEPVQGTRALVATLQQDPARRARVVSMLASIWRDGDVAALLADFGFSPRTSFLNELGERLRRRMLPLSPDTDDLGTLFNLLFDDPAWSASQSD